MIIDKILDNKNDLIEGTFCYELFENHVFNDSLFIELIKNIECYLTEESALKKDDVSDILNFISWFVINTMHCIICHNDKNDLYFIRNMDMNLWYERYENMLHEILHIALKNK